MTDRQTSESRVQAAPFPVIFLLAVLVANGIIFSSAISKGGWAAIGWLMFVSPVFNGMMLIGGTAIGLAQQRKHPKHDMRLYWLIVILPLLLAVAGWVVLSFSNIAGRGGC
jgi:hypothetical protein